VIAPGPIVAGAERVVLAGASAQRRAGRNVRLLALEARPGGAASFVAAAGEVELPIQVIPAPGSFDLHAVWRVRELIANLAEPALLHAHGYRALALCRAVALGGPQLVATVHGFTSHDRRARLYEAVERRMCRGTGHVVAVSEPLADQLRASGVREDRVSVVINPLPRVLPPATPPSNSDRRLRLLSVGRISREKGLDVLLRALALVPHLNLSVRIIGDGPLLGELERQVRDLSLGGRVMLSGYVDDVAPALGACDLFVLPSRTEGTPLSLIEAMAAGRPVVASDVGGVSAALRHGAGILTRPGDASELACALTSAVGQREQLSKRAMDRSESVRQLFSAERWAQQMERVYRSATGAS
jgi:glycosyltransferase involved in cell wall biosynthesis